MKVTAFTPFRDGDIRNTWEIDEMDDPHAFMRFVLSHASSRDRWICQGFDREATRALLRPLARNVDSPTRFLIFQFGTDDIEVPMDEETRSQLLPLLEQIDFHREPIAHHVSDGTRWLLVSYDNLSCCWVSKDIPRSKMEEAAADCRFHFIDPDEDN